MRTHLDPLDPNQSVLRPSIQRISELSTSLNPIEDTRDSTNSLAEQVRWAIQSPERIRHLVRNGNRDQAEADMNRLKSLLDTWQNVKDAQELLSQCKAALAFGDE
jgi:vacuolar protein sorting-associated protein 51